MPAYFPAFIAGERVRIKPASFLRTYLPPEWQWHHPLSSEQIGFAGEEASIIEVSFYHCGNVLFRLQGVPGYWHEACVEDCLFAHPLWDAYPRPSEYFHVEKVIRDGKDYVRIATKDGLECWRKYAPHSADQDLEKIRQIAPLRHFAGFQQRFDFHTGYQPDSDQWQRTLEKAFRSRFGLSEDAPLPDDQLTAEVLAVLQSGIPRYPIRGSHPRFFFVAAEWSRWERDVSDPADLEEDKHCRTLCCFYVRATPLQRQALREMARVEWSLLHFAHRAAVHALRSGEASHLLDGLLALSINDTADSLSGGLGIAGMGSKGSATLCMLEILSRVAVRIGADLAPLIEQAVEVSTPYTANVLRQASAVPYVGYGIEEYEDENGKMIGWPAWPRSRR